MGALGHGFLAQWWYSVGWVMGLLWSLWGGATRVCGWMMEAVGKVISSLCAEFWGICGVSDTVYRVRRGHWWGERWGVCRVSDELLGGHRWGKWLGLWDKQWMSMEWVIKGKWSKEWGLWCEWSGVRDVIRALWGWCLEDLCSESWAFCEASWGLLRLCDGAVCEVNDGVQWCEWWGSFRE